MKRKIICIVGPTASGKTSLAVWLAEKISGLPADTSGQLMQAGEIISADSRQVYKKLDIGTGKDLKDYGKIKYHLIDICEPGEKFTLFDWLEQAKKEIDGLFEKNIIPIIVGGTGLYVQALVEGFVSNQLSAVSNQQKKYRRKELEEKSLEQLQEIFSKLKIKNSKIDMKNPRRLIRVIELSQEGINPGKKKPDFDVLEIGITLEREELYEKIDFRVEEWFKQGFFQEVDDLLKSGISKKWLHDIGLEYRIVSEYALENREPRAASRESITESNKSQLEEFIQMKQEMKFAIHAYARRQLTWFRRFPQIKWVKSKSEALALVKDFLK